MPLFAFLPPNIEGMKNKRNIQGLIQAMKSNLKNREIRNKVRVALKEISQDSVEPLKKAFTDPNPDMRYFVLDALSTISDVRSLETFILALRDNDQSIRELGSSALFSLPQSFSPLLLPLLMDKDKFVRESFVKILCSLRDRKILNLLVTLVTNESEEKSSRITAASVMPWLCEAQDIYLVDTLVPLLKDKELVFYISWALHKMGVPVIVPLLDAYRNRVIDNPYIVSNIFSGIGEPAVSPLIFKLKSHKGIEAIPILIALISIGQPRIALGKFERSFKGDGRVIQPLINALYEKETSDIAAKGLAVMGEAAIKPLREVYRSGGDAGKKALETLRKMGEGPELKEYDQDAGAA